MRTQFKILTILCLVGLLFALSITSSAHSGKTDGNGGHYNNDTGEYHYHHGYPAHQHTNGECPYDFKDNTQTQKKSNNSSKTLPIVVTIIVVVILFLLFLKYIA